MNPRSIHFAANVRDALADAQLQAALGRAKSGFIDKRAKALSQLPEFEALRERGHRIKTHALAHLDVYLERYAEQVERRGGRVHWAPDAATANRAVVEICRAAGARQVIKSKTMVGEEIGLNAALDDAGLETVETDLGEYIIQLADEPPSHIIAPAVHKTRDQIVALFARHHHGADSSGARQVSELVDEARRVLRERFLGADVGITGANFLVADDGTALIATNEGNADLGMVLPRVHIVVTSIEKVVPTLNDATTLLRLLARSATGQEITTYTTLVTGGRRPDDADGPDEFHVVLVDNGRSDMLGGEYAEMLRCIRCGACLNHCPVYSAIGGHAYGWVYPGPMGSVLTPHFVGLDQSVDLPNACTLNGRCEEVCPVKIPLPRLLRQLRSEQFAGHVTPPMQRTLLRLWARIARHPRLYRLAARSGRTLLALTRRLGWGRPPLLGGWTQQRELPRPQPETFLQAWQKRRND